MTKEALEHYRTLIETQMAEIRESLEYLKGESKPVEPSVALGRLTRMEAISEKGVNEAMLSSAKGRLEKLSNALGRIDAGTYGLCVRCGGELPPGRLEAVPEALVCVPCLEKKAK